MQELSYGVRCLAGKSHSNAENLWLPLWMHLEDTAGIMEKLVVYWLSAAVSNTQWFKLDKNKLKKLCVFLAYSHDIGKATNLFQARILRTMPYARDRLNSTGIRTGKLTELYRLSCTGHTLAG